MKRAASSAKTGTKRASRNSDRADAGLAWLRRHKAAFHRTMLTWYEKTARDLPWRRTRDPYSIWLSEILLQQTRVEAGIPYYERFLSAFPDVQTLAAADEQAVLKLWEGLGYYTRARNLLKGARYIVRDCGGVFPDTAEGWREVPGVGPYTAGAVASIAFNRPEPLVDGNVKRVLSRWARYGQPDGSAQAGAWFWEAAKLVVHAKRPGHWNQSLMELGALVCLPKNPRCAVCPVRELCQGALHGDAAAYPVKKAKKALPEKKVVAGLIRRGGKILIARRGEGGMLAGMWEFPGGAVGTGETPEQALARIVRDETGVTIAVGRELAQLRHVYSHFAMELRLFACRCAGGTARAGGGYAQVEWVHPEELADYPMVGADRKLLAQLEPSVLS